MNTIMARKPAQPQIPPEAETTLEQRKELLFATITLHSQALRDIHAAQARGASPADMGPLYDREAMLNADKERLSHEVNSEYMMRNLGAFMGKVDEQQASVDKLIVLAEDNQSRLGKNEENISLVSDRVDTLEERADQTEAREQMRDDRIFAVEQRMTATELRMTDVEAQAAALEREHRQLITKLRRDAGLLKLISEESGGAE